MVQGGMWHLFCFDFQFYIEMFFGDTMNVSPILKKGNVTILTFLTHDEQITYSYDVQTYVQALIKGKKIYSQYLRIGKEAIYRCKMMDSIGSKIFHFSQVMKPFEQNITSYGVQKKA